MPGLSDSGQPDDVRIHLEQITTADKARTVAPEGESERDALYRTSAQLPQTLRARVEASLQKVSEAAPGLSAAEVAKLTTSRAGRDALQAGKQALARVDSHLQAVTGQRNPQIGRSYGVYGRNPVSFAGVYRALAQSVNEDRRLRALPESDPERAMLFTPLVSSDVCEAHSRLAAILGDRVSTRAELSREIALKDDVLDEAAATISAVRNHLYANLPERKTDPDLRDYGFRPVRAGRRAAQDGDEEEEAGGGVPAAGEGSASAVA
jgi:hypothetical protein